MVQIAAGLVSLHTFAIDLKNTHGIELPCLDQIQRVKAWTDEAQAGLEPEPIRVIEATPDELRRWTLDSLMAHNAHLGDHVSQLRKQAYNELCDQLVGQLDEVVLDRLRPAFDAAADKAREVVAMGVPPTATAEMFLDLPVEPRDAWKEFKTQHARTLDAVLGVRKALSGVFRLAPLVYKSEYTHPDTEEYDWGVAVTKPLRRLGQEVPGRRHERWLAVANDLHLNPINPG
ncbi:hypothetical protein [Aestuariimicrobium sp. Y1814]|uniref:hypothetical protein n=1 Tax=Aestuariimicrobium sp. Y1814 TaxID=3418742 RepID=UPI003DA753A7